MSAFAHHFGFEFKAGLRNPIGMMMFYLFPLGFYLLMGLLMVELNPEFTEVMIPALVIITVMAGTILGLPSQIVETREAGIYRSFKINRVPVGSILGVPVIAAVVHGLIASVLIAVTAGPLFGATSPTSWWGFLVITLVVAFSSGAIAALIAVVSSSSRGTVLWSQLIFVPSMMVGGLMFDAAFLPDSLAVVARLLPTTYAMQALLGGGFDGDTVMGATTAFVITVIVGVMAYALARLLFAWDSGNLSRRHPTWLALLVFVPMLVGVVLT